MLLSSQISSTQTQIINELGFNQSSFFSLMKYIDLVWTTNEELNLVSRQLTPKDFIENHIIDCLLPLKYFPANVKSVADFGSGGGLPAVIYALQYPNTEFHLFEKSPKKQDFLNLCKAITPNIKVQAEIPNSLKSIDLITARGFKPLDVILDISRDYYAHGGKYFLLKARSEKINEEFILAKKKFKNLEIKSIPLKSPVLDVERHLVSINL